MSTPPVETNPLVGALQALPLAVVTTDVRGVVGSVNCALTSLTGYSAAQLVGQPLTVLSFPSAGPSVSDILGEAIRSRQPWRGEWMCRHAAGHALTTEQSVTPIESPNGEIRHVVVTIEDITERNRTAISAAESLNDFERFFSLLPDLACVVSTDGHFKKVNPAWEATLGYTREEVLSIPMLELIHPDDLERTIAEVAKQSRTHRTKHFINRYRCKNGSYRLFDWTTTFNRDDSTRFGVARDIT
jgi:two-component system cell cycle sensor histidine kinase/response regulator CckA